MKYLPSSLIVLISILMLISCGGTGPGSKPQTKDHGPKPSWLQSYPLAPGYYIGIGSAPKSENPAEALRSAQDLALADLASQISVTITSDILTTLIEKGELSKDEYMATARSQAAAELEGHEFVDSWEDADYHYAYYRLSKAKYAEIQSRKRKVALGLALDHRSKAQAAEKLGDFAAMFSASVQGFTALLPYLNEGLKTEIDGQQVILSNALYQQIQAALSKITLTPNKPGITAKLGRSIEDRIEVKAQDDSGRPLKDLPLHVSFLKGQGNLNETAKTNGNGLAAIHLISIHGPEKVQVLEIAIDPSALLPLDVSPIVGAIVQSVPLARTQITIDVINPTIYLQSNETFDGSILRQSQVEPVLKNHFVSAGYHFVDRPEKADWQITVNASANAGTDYSGLFTAFADVDLSVVDLTSGEEIFKNSLKREKGIDLNYEAAGRKALSNAATKLSEGIIQEILGKL